MEKFFKNTLMMLMMIVCSVSMVSCGDDDDDNPDEPQGNAGAIVGTWIQVANKGYEKHNGVTVDSWDFSYPQNTTDDIWKFNADGSGHYGYFNTDTNKLTWDIDFSYRLNGTTLVISRGYEITYTVTNLTADGFSMAATYSYNDGGTIELHEEVTLRRY